MREPPLQAGRDCCLFPDIDGTLLHFVPTPGERHQAMLTALRRNCIHRWHSRFLAALVEAGVSAA